MAGPDMNDGALGKYGPPRAPRDRALGVPVGQIHLPHLPEFLKTGEHFDLAIIDANNTRWKVHKFIVCGHSPVLADEIRKLPPSDDPCLDMKHVPPEVLRQALLFMYNGHLDDALSPRDSNEANYDGVDRRPRILFTAELFFFANRYRVKLLRARALEKSFRDILIHKNYFPEDFPMLVTEAFGEPWTKQAAVVTAERQMEDDELLKDTPQLIRDLWNLPEKKRVLLWKHHAPGIRRNMGASSGVIGNLSLGGLWTICKQLVKHHDKSKSKDKRELIELFRGNFDSDRR